MSDSDNDSYPAILDELDLGRPTDLTPVGGGCIANAAVASFSDGTRVFIKQSGKHAGSDTDPRMFECEAEGLRALAATDALHIPDVLAVSSDALVLEYVETGTPSGDFFVDFGRRFALMHQTRGSVCGYAHDNFIGATPQPNKPVVDDWDEKKQGDGLDWPEFYMQRRLRPQVELAARNGHGDDLESLLDRGEEPMRDLLNADPVAPSLLHGDLWSGNFMVDSAGRACLIDPAVYYGHREADLAMTLLFGGFDDTFYAAYDEAWPLVHGWKERVPLYQLYHLLNHLNLFGSAYYARSKNILEQFAR